MCETTNIDGVFTGRIRNEFLSAIWAEADLHYGHPDCFAYLVQVMIFRQIIVGRLPLYQQTPDHARAFEIVMIQCYGYARWGHFLTGVSTASFFFY